MLFMQDTLQQQFLDSTGMLPAKASDSLSISAASKNVRSVHKSDSLTKLTKDSSYLIDVNLPVTVKIRNYSDSTEGQTINLFKGHELKPIVAEPRVLAETNPNWVFLLIVLSLMIIAYIRLVYNKYLLQLVSAFFNNNITNQIVRDENLLIQRASVLLSTLFIISAALMLYIISIHFNWSLGGMPSGFLRFLFLALIISTVQAGKFLILKACGYLFNQNREIAAYIFNIFLINNLFGIFIIPLISLMAFGHILSLSLLIKITLVLALLAYLYRLVRGVLIGIRHQGFSPFYLFLYLCTLEITPLLICIKLITQQ